MSTQIDPICGMAVEETQGIHSRYNDTTYYFCSVDCHKKFEELLRETSEAFKGYAPKLNVNGPDQKTDETRKDWEISESGNLS